MSVIITIVIVAAVSVWIAAALRSVLSGGKRGCSGGCAGCALHCRSAGQKARNGH